MKAATITSLLGRNNITSFNTPEHDTKGTTLVVPDASSPPTLMIIAGIVLYCTSTYIYMGNGWRVWMGSCERDQSYDSFDGGQKKHDAYVRARGLVFG